MKRIRFIFSLALIFSCTKSAENGECYRSGQALIDTITGPSVVNVGQQVSVHVILPFADRCYGVRAIPVNRLNDSLYDITARYESIGCVCTMVAGTIDSTISIQPARPGLFRFRYKNNDQQYRYYQVTVQ